MKLIVVRNITLGKLKPGSLFLHGMTFGLKTEYRAEGGAIEAFIVGSGEMFWGGTNNPIDQANLVVTEVKVKGFNKVK